MPDLLPPAQMQSTLCYSPTGCRDRSTCPGQGLSNRIYLILTRGPPDLNVLDSKRLCSSCEVLASACLLGPLPVGCTFQLSPAGMWYRPVADTACRSFSS